MEFKEIRELISKGEGEEDVTGNAVEENGEDAKQKSRAIYYIGGGVIILFLIGSIVLTKIRRKIYKRNYYK
jgi:hypothetical protein